MEVRQNDARCLPRVTPTAAHRLTRGTLTSTGEAAAGVHHVLDAGGAGAAIRSAQPRGARDDFLLTNLMLWMLCFAANSFVSVRFLFC